ncbi:MAG: hypothetical protein Q6373_016865 [Candidatus Sigynarchaeota archaeon]
MNDQKVFSPWHEEFPLAILEPCRSGTKHPLGKGILSPLSNLTISLLKELAGKRNIIISTPLSLFFPLPIIAYIFAKRTQKAVFIFTKASSQDNENPFLMHYRNYYLLQANSFGDASDYIFKEIPVGEYKDGRVTVDFFLPTATPSFKREYEKHESIFLERVFLDGKRGKVIFFTSDQTAAISDTFQKLIIGEISHEGQFNIVPGTIIFENMDRLIYSESKLKSFLEWIKAVTIPDLKFILHFSNPNSKFILPLKEELDALMFHYSNSFLKNNPVIRNKATTYFATKKAPEIECLNLDKESVYKRIKNIQIVETLEGGNIDRYFIDGMDLLNQINLDNLPGRARHLFLRFRSLYYIIFDLVINPAKLVTPYVIDDEWTSMSLLDFTSLAYRDVQSDDNYEGREILLAAIRDFYCIIVELKECKRWPDEKAFSRISKHFAIIKYIRDHPEEKFVLVVNKGEKSCLEDIFSDDERFLQKNLKIKMCSQIVNMVHDLPEWTLILPGPILPKYSSIFFKAWKNVVFFAYGGKNQERVNNLINIISTLTIEDEGNSVKHLQEITNYLKAPEMSIVADYKKRKEFIKDQKEGQKDSASEMLFTTEEISQLDDLSISSIIMSIIKDKPDFLDFADQQQVEDALELETRTITEKLTEHKFSNKNHWILHLENEQNGEMKTVRVPLEKTYLYMENKDSDVNTGYPGAIEEGSYIILFDQEDKKSIIDFMEEIIGDEVDINKEFIDEWRGRLARYYEKNYTSPTRFHRDYAAMAISLGKTPRTVTTIRKWIDGSTMYTIDPEDLYILGKMMKDSFFLENYNRINREGRKIQQYHMKLSRMIQTIAKQILNRRIDTSKYSLEEYEIFKTIQNNIFILKDKQKIIVDPSTMPSETEDDDYE